MSNLVGAIFGKPSQSTTANATVSPWNNLPGFAQNAAQQAVTGIQNLSPSIFTPSEFSPMQNQAFGIAQEGFIPINEQTFGKNLDMFMNPFTQNVVDATNKQLMIANQGLLSQIAGDATRAGAFGSTRQGAAEALQNKNTLDTIAATTAGLNAAGYNTAAQQALDAINQTNQNRQSQISNLSSLGSVQQDYATAQKQAPLTALQAMLAAAMGIPTSSGAYGTSSSTGGFGGIIPNYMNALGGKASSMSGG